MYKWTFFGLIVIACAVGIFVLFDDVSTRSAERAAEAAEASKPQLRLTATNWKFDQEVYEVELGSTLPVTLRNAEGVHAVHISGYDVELSTSDPTKEITFDKPGEYEIKCSLMCGPGHDGMISKLIVK